MNDKLIGTIIFAAGAATGSIATWKFVENKYKKIADEEINSVKEVFNKKYRELTTSPTVSTTRTDNKIDTKNLTMNVDLTNTVKDILKKEGYNKEADNMNDKQIPYVISPEEFGTKDYDQVDLIYYADEILATEDGDILDDPDSVVGMYALDSFGQYEDDSVFVRDDSRQIDYEILKDLNNYPSGDAMC